VTGLPPKIGLPLPTRLSLRQTPSVLCDLLNRDELSPFCGLIRRPSASAPDGRRYAVITDTGILQMLQESMTSPSGCLFPYRNLRSGDTDVTGMWAVLMLYWTAVRDTFPDAWGRPPSGTGLMHGAGIRAMGRLMDRVMAEVDPRDGGAAAHIRGELALLAPHCHWTSGRWVTLGLRWNEIQNVPRHTHELSSFLVRTYMQARTAQR
jgi:hypothetical protein